jgi:two-component system sensor histidine kinase PilS (NtrC family)
MAINLQGKEREDWRLLRIYAGYRLALSLLLIILFTIKPSMPMIGGDNPPLFFATVLGYFITAISATVFIHQPRTRIPSYSLILLLIDIFALTLMTHASGGLNTQISLLYLVTIAAGNILLAGRMGTLVAAVASIAILYEQFYFALSSDDFSAVALAQSSILGISFFAVALLSQVIVLRMRQGEALAERRAHDITTLQRLNEQVIRRMRTGIIAINRNRSILLSNEAAQQLLGLMAPITPHSLLDDVSLSLGVSLSVWQQNPLLRITPFKNTQDGPEISISFAPLAQGQGKDTGTVLLFLEDTTQLGQQVQQLKLASLGRLTASIAHEVRNPLGAISHATQLLAESNAITGADRRLLEIIEQHCKRMNSVIENVLSVSRRQPSLPQIFSLQEWVTTFRDEYLEQADEPTFIGIDFPGAQLSAKPLNVRFDPEQLQQVISNLVMNGLRYSHKRTGSFRIRLEGAQLELNDLPYLDVVDDGDGISPAQREHLFEPFYTTESNGTGLGLYLSREICEANQARLDYIPRLTGACFRITFAHPDRLS